MIVLSTLSRAARLPAVFNKTTISKIILAKQQNVFKQAFRNMSDDDRTFYVEPSRFQYTQFKDDLHFYISIGTIPLVLLIMYVNIFIGPATLTEIPEDYEPKHWEYFKHPISRFFSKHFHDDPQVLHEQLLHGLHEEKAKHDWSDTIRKAKKLMSERDDYKAWYFLPSDQGRHYRFARKEADDLYEFRGYR